VPFPRPRVLVPLLLLALTACGNVSPPAPSTAPVQTDASAAPTASPTPGIGEVISAPGSDSEVYAPNPGALVVAIDPGHGGCLDFGVPDPSKRGKAFAEKTMTLGIGLALRKLLTEQGVTVVMTRQDDSALAGDDYPPLGCNGPAWRDVDGDGEAGFEPSGHTRTRDELSARIDMANLARADVLVSIHINSMTQNGKVYPIAASQTFYDDETPWGSASGELAQQIQADVVASMQARASYPRQDRHTQAVSYYIISRRWAAGDTCDEGGEWCKPHRALEMPGVLSEVGSISLEAEQDLLVTPAGQEAAAEGVPSGLAGYFGQRQIRVRYDALVPGGAAGEQKSEVAGSGPPFWAPELGSDARTVTLRLTNTGMAGWPAGVGLVGAWQPSDLPYLAAPPAALTPLAVTVPALAPGASVELQVPLPERSGATRQIVWISLADASGPLSQRGSPALQLATGHP
jgi:N-acetylmuramoyl-L-alanine amidase